MDIAEEMTAMAAVGLLAFSPQDEEGIGLQCSREALVSSLERDLQGPRVRVTLQGLYDMLVDGEHSHRAAVGEVLDTVSWEAFGLVVGCLERFATSPSPNSSGSVTGTFEKSSDEAETLTTSRDADDCAALSEGLALAMAEIFSPKELHLMTLEHLHAYTKARTVRVVLTILRRSTERMATARRSKFLEASLRPALKAAKRVGLVAAAGDAPAEPGLRQKSSGSDADEDPDDDGTGRDRGEEPPPPPPLLPTADGDMPSSAAYDAAASAAETAADFIGPLMEQASAERALLAVSGLPTAGRGEGRPAAAAVAASAGGSGHAVGSGEKEGVSASDLSLAAYIGFALSALELAGETSVCCTAAAAAAAAATGSEDNPAAGESLARAEERLIGIVVDSPLDLRFALLHGCRVSYASGVKRRRRKSEGGGEEGKSQLPAARLGGAVGLAEAAVNGALPWTLRGVSTLAYLVACEPRLRDKWLPLVWSRRTERRLFLPHAEVLMRDRSRRVANKGLELACFVAERLGGFPDRSGAYAFDWEPGDEEIDGAGDDGGGGGAWNGGGRQEVLVDVMVSCPLPGLRTRGHAALVAILSGADEASRFRLLRRLVELCPWPNLLRACRRGPLASLMADMDSRTGGLALARYAHKLDAVGGARADSGRAEAGAAWGRLGLREPKKLLQNRLLVQGLLDELRGAVITANNAGPEHFRLFILEDAAQQCLQELELAVV
ncbi:hypothetical protein Esi_0455_0005 [Ectocarpus siliculosus]|uniref:Uncharacterized protein n=1 Tax=Ectocarpus siliculosus TaxID=2880 RepID=D7G1P6_ECTSI|nr:hypothetical protein Esi_0455_0005 [Ectocarpus siliculosus]|eukprot:CBJ33291.1 hypothetical protein Esi_0455_0005 [Ectocarpus siliculosus]